MLFMSFILDLPSVMICLCADSCQPHRATPVWVQREQVSPFCRNVFCVPLPAQPRYILMIYLKSCLSHTLCHRSVFDCFFSWSAGVCWRNPSESKPSWPLCRPAGRSLSSWRRWRRWSLLLKNNSWMLYGFISTSRRTNPNISSLFYRGILIESLLRSLIWSHHCSFPLQVRLSREPGRWNHLSYRVLRQLHHNHKLRAFQLAYSTFEDFPLYLLCMNVVKYGCFIVNMTGLFQFEVQ